MLPARATRTLPPRLSNSDSSVFWTSQPSYICFLLLSTPLRQPSAKRMATGRPGILSQYLSYPNRGSGFHASGRNRTYNLGIKSPLLCQLSYGRVPCCPGGEPPTGSGPAVSSLSPGKG
jgi:hypothetical protein